MADIRDVLREHYLFAITCDHERKQDNPICACSRIFLGWHPTVGAAVDAWIEHVMSICPTDVTIVRRESTANCDNRGDSDA